MAHSMDEFLPNVLTQDTRKRIATYEELAPYLRDPDSSLQCEDTDKFVDGLAQWVSSSNYKISLNGLEVLSLFVDRFGEQFKPHVTAVLPQVVDRLGDSKDQVRESAQELLQKLIDPASSPQYIFDRMMNAFSHKLWRVKEETCICLQKTLNAHGGKCLILSKIVPVLIKLLEDQSIPVREASINTLVEIYRNVGERMRHDLCKKDISQSKLNTILTRMDEVKNSGTMVISEGRDETDFTKPVGIPKGSKRFPGSGTATLQAKKSVGAKATGPAGALDEDAFMKAFEEVPKVHIFSGKELADKVGRIKETLSDTNYDWEKRTEALKEIRSLVIAGAADYDEFPQLLRQLESCVTLSAKDLRSQVVREACITISYLSQLLGNKFDHFAECVLPVVLGLLSNSAKIMASSGSVCVRYIIQHTHATRLIPIITGNTSAKSNVLRKDSYEMLDVLLHTWPTHPLERHIAAIQEAIKKGITDADSEARAHSRKAFWGFAEHFRDQADSLLNSLDPSKQKMLQGELSNSSSSNSLSSGGGASRVPSSKSRSRSMSSERSSQQLYSRTLASSNAPRRAPVAKTPGSDHTDGTRNKDSGGILRSSSAVDLTSGPQGASRVPGSAPSSAHSNYSSLRPSRSSADLLTPEKSLRGSMRRPRTSLLPTNTPSSRPKKKPSSSTVQSIISPERSRTRSRIGVSQSQPGSRSTSPSSRLSYITHNQQQQSNVNGASSRPRHKSGIPRSQGASRETSPSRQYSRRSGIPRSQGASRETSPSRQYGRERRVSGSQRMPAGRVSRNANANANTGTSVLQHHTLPQGFDVEDALADALTRGGPIRRRYETYDSDDAASETSSVCSERSFSSYGKTSEDLGERRSSLRVTKLSRSREDCLHSPFAQDMSEIVSNLSSGSWADRKEGLIALQNLLRGSRLLNRLELKKVTEIFTRMFHDPHGKVFSVFMDTLIELFAAHRAELHDWLHVCLTRLLNKMGADLLGSVQVKVQRALEAVRDSFPYDHQFQIVNRFIVDQTQTPNLKFKVKVALMNYMHGLALLMDPSEFTNTSDTRLAVSRIITWTTEPKSVDVRKAAQAVLIALFNLNSPEFSMMLSVLPKTFQDGATRILHNHLRSSSQDAEPLSPRNITSPTYGNRYRQSANRPTKIEDTDTENMNPEDIYNSIKKTSADIQNLSKIDSQYEVKKDSDTKKERDSTSQDSGIQGSFHDLRGNSPDIKNTQHSRGRQYNPSYYQDDNLNGYNKAALAEAVFDVDNDMFNEGFNEDIDQSDIVAEILTELSNHNERSEERTSAMLSLIKITREGSAEVWDEHFKTILLLLLETLGDTDGQIRTLALRVLREILRHEPTRFKEYAELTVLKILEAHKDQAREVCRAAEEAATTLAHSIATDQCIRVLNPIIQTADFPVNLAAIKMETKVIENADKEVIRRFMPDVIPGLLMGYDNRESPVRKASVFCLVAIYMSVGDDLKPYVDDLSGSKLKLLNLYIKRSLAEKGHSGPGLYSTDTSKTTSPASTITDLGL